MNLDEARGWGDAPADALLAEGVDRVWAANAALRAVRRNDDPLPEALEPAFRAFLEAHASPPPWLDRTRVLRAQRWAHEHLFHVTTALFCASLPSAYAAAEGARVLVATGRMHGDLDRRVNETARFVIDVLEPGSLEPAGSAVATIRKVRLVHAAVRALIPATPGEVPINQEDQLGTLLSFSVAVVRALRRLGIAVDPAEAEDFWHLWRGVGAMLGVREALLPPGWREADAAADRIADRQFRPSDHGRALTAALLARIEAHLDVPGLRGAPRFLIRYLVGERTAEILGLPATRGLPTSVAARFAMRAFAETSVWTRVTPLVGRRLLDAVIAAKLGTTRVDYPMPTRLGG